VGRPRRVGPGYLAILGFAVAAAWFYRPVLFGGLVLVPLDNLWLMPPWFGPPGAVPHNFLVSDMLLQNYPWKLILEQALRQRELPLWNPYELAGLPYLGTAQTGVLYPFTALFLLLGPLQAYGWFSALHQVLAGSLTYLFLRRLGIGRFGAVVAGFVFAFSFFLTVSYLWPMVLGAAIWLPLALWSVTGLAQAAATGRFGRALAVDLPVGALAVGLSVLGGHLEITFYSTFAVGLYALFLAVRLGRTERRPAASGRFVVAAGLAIGLGVLLASVQLLPFLDALGSNNRQGDTSYRQVISYALPHRQVLGLLMPDFFGNPTAHDYLDLATLQRAPVERNALGQPTDTIFWGTKNYVEAGGYVGVVPLLLAMLGAIRSRHRDRWFFVGLAVLSLLLAFGTPLYALIYYGLPFFSQLRTPFRWLYLFDFAAAVLAGFGADALWRRQEPEGHGHWLPPVLGFLGLAALAASFAARQRSIAFADGILARSPELQQAFASGAMLYSYEFRNVLLFFGLLAVGGTLVALLARLQSLSSILRTLAAGLLLLTIVGDLFYFGMRFASKEPAAILDQRIDVNLALPPDLAGPRYVSLGDPVVLRANLGVLLGLPGVSGYDTIVPSRFVRLWSLIEPPVDLPFNQIGRLHRLDSLGSPILDLLGVRYVLAEVPADTPAARLSGQLGPIRIYQRSTALPRAFVVPQARWVPDADAAFKALAESGFQPARVVVLEGAPLVGGGGAGTATIASYSLDRVTLQATTDGPAWLVLADANAPGWVATVDGASVPVLTADGYLRAVPLPAGTHAVVFHFSPVSFQFGAYLSLLAVLGLALIVTRPLWRRLTGHYVGQVERVFRNTTLPMATSFLNKAIDFGFAALLLRVLGPKSVGEYTLAIVLMGYVEIFTNFGLNSLIIREVARDREKSGHYLANAVALRLALCALAAPFVGGVILFGHSLFGVGDQAIVAFALLTLSLIPSNITATLSGLFNAWERIDVPATITVATTLARVTLGAAALLLGAGIVGLAAISLALNLVLVVTFILLAQRLLHVHLVGPAPAELPAMLIDSYPLFLNQVLVTIFFKIDVVLLQVLQGSEILGYYATAYKWVDGVLIIPSTFTFAIFPALSRFAQEKGNGLRDVYDLAVRILVVVAIPLSVAIAFLSDDLILLLGGRAYYPQSAQALALLIWFLPFSYVNGVTQYALIAVNRQRFLTLAFVIAAAFNIGANLLLIPHYGFYATSAVTVASEAVLLVPFLIAARQSIGWPNWLVAVGKPALAGAMMVLVILVGRQIELHLALVVAGALYLVAIWALGIFSAEELAVLGRLLRRQRIKTASAIA
jgi:O-antigen/teichoic acid export membrane protein